MKIAIGMYFLDSHIHMAQVSWRRGKPTVVRTVDCPWDKAMPDDQAESLARNIAEILKREGFVAAAPVAMGLPGDWVSYVSLETDAIDDQDLTQVLRFELEDDVPIPFDNFQMGIMGAKRAQNKLRGLVAVCDRFDKDRLCQLLDRTGLNIQSMCPDLAGLGGLAGADHAKKHISWMLHLHVEDMRCLLLLSQNGVVSIGRSLQCGTAPQASLKKPLSAILHEVFGAHLHGVKPEDVAVLVTAPQRFRSEILGEFSLVWEGAVEFLDTDELQRASKPSCVAEGLAVAHFRGDSMSNFMASQLTQKHLKKELKLAGGLLTLLLVLILVLWGAGAYLKITTLKQRQSQLTQAIETVFTENVPEVTKIVQPVAQMANYVDQYRKESEFLMEAVKSRALPLQVLENVSQHVTEESKISIIFIEVDSAKVSLEGTAPSYESVESLAEDLRGVPGYTNVQLDDVSGAKTGSQVRFKLSLSRGINS